MQVHIVLWRRENFTHHQQSWSLKSNDSQQCSTWLVEGWNLTVAEKVGCQYHQQKFWSECYKLLWGKYQPHVQIELILNGFMERNVFLISDYQCRFGRIQCNDSSICLWQFQLCDGVENCQNGMDELDCGKPSYQKLLFNVDTFLALTTYWQSIGAILNYYLARKIVMQM